MLSPLPHSLCLSLSLLYHFLPLCTIDIHFVALFSQLRLAESQIGIETGKTAKREGNFQWGWAHTLCGSLKDPRDNDLGMIIKLNNILAVPSTV